MPFIVYDLYILYILYTVPYRAVPQCLCPLAVPAFYHEEDRPMCHMGSGQAPFMGHNMDLEYGGRKCMN